MTGTGLAGPGRAGGLDGPDEDETVRTRVAPPALYLSCGPDRLVCLLDGLPAEAVRSWATRQLRFDPRPVGVAFRRGRARGGRIGLGQAGF
jgi:hypothetical protein